MLRKIIDGTSLEISRKDVFDVVSFSRVRNLQCSDCNSAIKITHHRYSFENVPNNSCLKKHILRKKCMLDQLPNKVRSAQFYEKSELL